jgi:hypothetical protein
MNFLKKIPWTMGIWWKHLIKLAWIKFPKGYKFKGRIPHYLYFIQDWFEVQFCNITLFISFHVHVSHVIKMKIWTWIFFCTFHVHVLCFDLNLNLLLPLFGLILMYLGNPFVFVAFVFMTSCIISTVEWIWRKERF